MRTGGVRRRNLASDYVVPSVRVTVFICSPAPRLEQAILLLTGKVEKLYSIKCYNDGLTLLGHPSLFFSHDQ